MISIWPLVLLAGTAIAEPSTEVRFNRDIRPILADNCLACHGADEAALEAGLRLDDQESAYAERDGVRAIVPGDPEASALVERIFSEDSELVMPPPKHPVKLKDADKQMLVRWIEQGAKYEGHWAFQEVERPDVPADAGNAVDYFIEKRLKEIGLEENDEASRETLLRRLSLDLIGLPPTPEEVNAFLADDEEGAYERQVDRLLSSPHYGERMAMWWLDGARYADTHGFQADWERYQWPWRDWVIEAFNNNQPFDQFTVEQIAGDMLPNATTKQKVATGFGRNHRINTEGGALPEEWLIENVMDRVDTVGAVWLGLTMSCARCHDHKYDPLTQREFYQFFAFFNNIPEEGKGPGRQGNFKPIVKLATPDQEKRFAELTQEIESTDKQLVKWLPSGVHGITKQRFEKRGGNADNRLKKAIQGLKQPEAQEIKKHNLALRKEREGLEKDMASVMVMQEMETPRKTFMLDRGEYHSPTEEVHAALPAFLPPMPEGEPMNRLGLARWLVSSDQPLTARVQVNRLWELFFGTGLVATSENLGVQTEWPSHPQLLDWLSAEFMESGWDVKALVKLIVMSDTYRQNSSFTPEKLERDPENRLLARGPRFRVQAEIVRDQALAISGLLNKEIGGPSSYPYQPKGIWSETNFYGNLKNYNHATDGTQYRRSLYTIWKRTAAPPGMTLFDMPSREVCVVKRARSNTPLQALALMNDVTYVEAARIFAENMMANGITPEQWIAWGWKKATARDIEAGELDVLMRGFKSRHEFYSENPDKAKALISAGEAPVNQKDFNPVTLAAMSTTASVILNLDEVITKE